MINVTSLFSEATSSSAPLQKSVLIKNLTGIVVFQVPTNFLAGDRLAASGLFSLLQLIITEREKAIINKNNLRLIIRLP
ncbi:hypothetical protein BMS3Abin03_00314 [bacterium BMS3Abin03]|nr:hypothetical protein BMS3Abin03_00314 [bacterium BMS3Abin03]